MGNGLSDYDAQLVSTMNETAAHVYDDEVPFRIALLGDWSGRANRNLQASSEEVANIRPLVVDRDNLDEVMNRLGVKLQLTLDEPGISPLKLNFKELADFHPDRLFSQLDVFESLQHTRRQLSKEKTFAEAAARVRSWSGVRSDDELSRRHSAANTAQKAPSISRADIAISGGSLLDQILTGTSPGSESDTDSPNLSKPKSPAVSPEISALAREAVKPYASPDNEAERQQLTGAVDARIAAIMSGILHHSDFQALESAWRALDFLVNRLETGTDLKIFLLDISFAELQADLRSHKDYRNCGIYKLAVEQTVGTPGAQPWAVIAGNYTFDFATDDAEVIQRISLIAKEAGAPFVCGATPHLLGCASLFETPDPDDWQTPLNARVEAWWEAAVASPSANYIGLALPRFLVRLPYGKKTEPTEEFEFEEIPDTVPALPDRHELYLWANPAFVVALLLGKGFSENGWDFRPGDSMEVEGLPMHIYEHDGETEIKPCAEILLRVRAAEKLIDRGLMPLISMKDSDTVRLGMFQSIASSRLGGGWNR